MSDFDTQKQQDTAEDAGKKTAVPTEDKDTQQPAELTFTPAQQAHLDRVIEERLSRQRAQFKKAEDDAKTKAESQRLAEQGEFKALADQRAARIAELETELKTREVNTLRATIAARHKLPEHWIPRLMGDTEADIDADAARIAKDLAPPKAPNTEGGEKGAGLTKAQSIERARAEAMKTGKYAA